MAHLVLFGFAVFVLILVARLPFRADEEDATWEDQAEEMEAHLPVESTPVEWSVEASGPLHEPASRCEKIRGVVRRRETVSDILLRHGFSHELVHAANRCAKPVFDLRRIRAGQGYCLAKVGTTFCHFTYEIDPERYLLIASRGRELHSEIREYPFTVRVDSLMGTIASSLFQSVLELGEGPDLALGLSEIFAWDVDFFLDIRKGDRFKFFFEKKCLEDSVVCYGRILAAEFVVQGAPHRAIYFCDETGYDDYYDPEGESLRKALLKAPLRYTRISSGFSHRRFHPIRRRYAPHLGLDYAAPTGTPVRATGDGSVVFSARSGASGKMIEIRHNETYTTYYLHLSQFAKGIKKGKSVKQGDVIGYVGSTGLSTGPHLDYRIKKHGKFIDPRKVDLPSAEPVAEAYRAIFESLRDGWMARLEQLGSGGEDELVLGEPVGSGSPASARQ